MVFKHGKVSCKYIDRPENLIQLKTSIRGERFINKEGQC
jgi:hypothetical protein